MLASEPALKIGLFGCPRVLHTQTGISSGLGRPTRLLMARLLLNGQRSHNREVLAEKLWPTSPPDSAARAFRTALWRLRRVLEPQGLRKGTYLIVNSNGEVGFNWVSDFTADVLDFEDGVSGLDQLDAWRIDEQHVDALKNALNLYSGELLEGSVDEWVTYERERFRRLYLKGLDTVMHATTESGNLDAAIRYGRKILALDPYCESTQGDLLHLYARNGQFADCVRFYENLESMLKRELGVEPSPSTKAVYQAAMNHRDKVRLDSGPAAGDMAIQDAVREMKLCLDEVEQSQKRLKAKIDRVMGFLAPR